MVFLVDTIERILRDRCQNQKSEIFKKPSEVGIL